MVTDGRATSGAVTDGRVTGGAVTDGRVTGHRDAVVTDQLDSATLAPPAPAPGDEATVVRPPHPERLRRPNEHEERSTPGIPGQSPNGGYPHRLRASVTVAADPTPTDGPAAPVIAVLLPCRNEAPTIGAVVRGFAAALPGAQIWVYDNGSSDDTAEVARAAGALVHHEHRAGKGHVVRRMFSEVDADVYVMADGDGTYDWRAAPRMVAQLVDNRLDMVIGRRCEVETAGETYRPGHRLGNSLLTGVVRQIFGQGSLDVLSGYRVFSRRFVKSFPAASCRFELETEMTVHALDLRMPFAEVDTEYRDRHAESASKLRTLPDGLRILKFIGLLAKDYRPGRFFAALGLMVAALALVARVFVFGMLSSALSPSGARAVVSGLLVVVAVLLGCGILGTSLNRTRRDINRMVYLGMSGPPGSARPVSVDDRSARPAPVGDLSISGPPTAGHR